MLDSMRRADRPFWKLLAKVEKETKLLVGSDRKTRRTKLNQITAKVEKWALELPISIAAVNGLSFDVHAQASSYLELLDSGQDASWPVQPSKKDPFDEGLDALVKAVTLEELTDATEKMAMTVSINLRSQSQYDHQKSH